MSAIEGLKRELLDLDGELMCADRQDDGTAPAAPALLINRIQGRDWPISAYTMIGQERLDDLQACVEQVVKDGVPGDLIEAGVWRGGACMLMRAVLNELEPLARRTVYVADSFAGFRPDSGDPWEAYLSRYGVLGVSLEEVKAGFARFGLTDGVRFVVGYFEHSLAQLADNTWALIRCDSDTLSATKATLEALEPGLSPGGYVVVDDYRILAPVREATDAYRRQMGITEPLEECDSWNAVRWRKR